MGFYLTYILVGCAIFGFIALFTLFAVYAERKIAGFVQDRLGPMETGRYGGLQTVSDILKLIQKEFITPSAADRPLFVVAPVVIFLAVFLGFLVIPWAPDLVLVNLNLSLFYVLAILAIDAVGILMAGWSSNNKFSLLGAMRAVAQIVSYEIPAGIALISVVMIAQTLNMQALVVNQGVLTQESLLFIGFWDVSEIGGIFAWHVFQAPHLLLAFVIFFIASLAECNRAPFDIPEAESELVAGFQTEYGGLRFAFIMLAEYAMMFLLSAVAVVLFLGGWNSPLPNLGGWELATWTTGSFWGIWWMLMKTLVLVGLQMWIRWTLPRFRVDQLMQLCWKVLTPLAFLCMAISGVWRIWIMV